MNVDPMPHDDADNADNATADETKYPAETKSEESPASVNSTADSEVGSSRVLPLALTRYTVCKEGEPLSGKLDMEKCSVKPPLLQVVCDYLALLNTPLVRLTLSKNLLGPRGAVLLGKALITNNSLQTLELDQCELVGSAYRPQYEGIMTLAKGFESVRSTLRSISLASNALQPEGCRIILGALSFHPTLTALDISSNMLASFSEKQGYLALSYLIQYAKHLCSLTIDDNMLPPASLRVLQSRLDGNTTLTSLSALRCGLSSHTLQLPHRATQIDPEC